MGEQDIKRLFLYKGELEIKEGDEVIGKVYQRILNNADVERARRESLRESAKLRKRLKDSESDDYMIFIAPLLDMGKEGMVGGIVASELRVIREEAYQEAQREIPLPSRPEEDSLEKLEEYQESMDSYNARILEKTVELLAKKSKEKISKLEKEEDVEKLKRIYESVLIKNLCSNKMFDIYQLWSAYLGTYKDEECKKRLFDSFDDFSNTATELQRQLIDGYFMLEIDKLTLKK